VIETTKATALYLDMVEGTHAVRHTSWVGRAIALEDLAVASALRGDVPPSGPEAGYVAQRDRIEPDVTAIAAPIRWAGGIAGALNLLGATYRIDETGELVPVDVGDVVADEGAALVIRAGGGRVGESFPLNADRMTIGRRPDSDIFLDDVTVSRDHALLVRRSGDYYLDDLGSLNGTYVNRHRIESHRLEDGDELQVGKFKLTYISR